jgi:hypothetical protein
MPSANYSLLAGFPALVNASPRCLTPGVQILGQARSQAQLSCFLDVLTAEVAPANAEMNYARTIFNYERAKAELDFAT